MRPHSAFTAVVPRMNQTMTASIDTNHHSMQFVRVCMDNQPANVRLFVMHGGVETFVELVGSAFTHAHSLSASSSAAPMAITDGSANTTQGNGTEASPTGSSGSEEHFGSSSSNGNRVPRRERASDLSVALTCRELVVECISCLSSALEVRVWQSLLLTWAFGDRLNFHELRIPTASRCVGRDFIYMEYQYSINAIYHK